ncbi:ferrochelatase [Corynebacterium atypicum]|uniref:ferrochelatase n=1 Tax=Corynebacterium atypicum TaxID=191610 RepID=UPI000689658C|nr:ferrochelatase [Corynebacterium atypicum]
MTHGLPYDALLVLSFGGPEAPEEVIPFLQNVTRGRGIPVSRLEVVGEHYYHFGGKSPLNDLNLEMIDNIKAELGRRDYSLPVYFGNRNWHPLFEDTAEQMARDGVRRALVFATSAWGGYSGATQYDEDISRIREHLSGQGLLEIEWVKLRQFFNHPGFIREVAAGLRDARAKFGAAEAPRLIFTAHSVPLSKPDPEGRPTASDIYLAQVREAARLVALELGTDDYDVVWQSRSGPPHQPWLEPDVVDHVTRLHEEEGLDAVLCCPIGFISDHMEVVWDLDTELRQACEEMGVHLVRARTAGTTRNFASTVVNLVEEASGLREVEFLGERPGWGVSVNGQLAAQYPAGAPAASGSAGD